MNHKRGRWKSRNSYCWPKLQRVAFVRKRDLSLFFILSILKNPSYSRQPSQAETQRSHFSVYTRTPVAVILLNHPRPIETSDEISLGWTEYSTHAGSCIEQHCSFCFTYISVTDSSQNNANVKTFDKYRKTTSWMKKAVGATNLQIDTRYRLTESTGSPL